LISNGKIKNDIPLAKVLSPEMLDTIQNELVLRACYIAQQEQTLLIWPEHNAIQMTVVK